MTQEVRIPDIGDVDEVEVIEICVALGDQVGPDDALIVIESDKASMEVPAGSAGTIASIDVAVGDQVTEGSLVVTLASADSRQEAEPATDSESDHLEDSPASDELPEADQAAGQAEPESTAVSAATRSLVEVRVPDIGEATNVVVIEVAVVAGTEVGADDLLVVVESDKASMEIPAGQAGTVTAVHVEEGGEVAEGTLIATIEAVAGVAPSVPAATRQAEEKKPGENEVEVETAPKPAVPAAAKSADAGADDAGNDQAQIYASPVVRRLARELGVKLSQVKGSGSRGRILKDDVKTHVKAALSKPASEAAGVGIPSIPVVDFSRFGEVEVRPMSRIQVAGAKNLHRSWLNLPHVTQFEEADVTELEAFRKTLKEESVRRDVKITPLSFIIKACCYALQEFPTFNASLDPEIKNYLLKRYYHIGFAVDTPDGLVVPVIRDADRMGVWDLSEAITELAEKARTGKLGMSDLQGGSFSISSLGNIGGTGFTPIINAPEVAILGVSRLVTKPIWNGTEFAPRKMLPLSLSYDHRAINGAEGGRFMVMLAELLGDIRRLAL